MKKTRFAGGIFLLAALLLMAVQACAPANLQANVDVLAPTQPSSDSISIQSVHAKEPENFVAQDDILSQPPTKPSKPAATIEVVANAQAAINLGEIQTVSGAGFSFRPIQGYDLHLKADQATLASQDGKLILSMSGVTFQNVQSLEGPMTQLLEGVGEGMDDFQTGAPYPVKIGEKTGLIADLTGKLEGVEVTGQVLMLAASESRLFYAVAIAVKDAGGADNLFEDNPVIEAVIETVTFIEPETP